MFRSAPDSIDISKIWILHVRQVLKRQLRPLLLVDGGRVSLLVLAREDHVERDGCDDADYVARERERNR